MGSADAARHGARPHRYGSRPSAPARPRPTLAVIAAVLLGALASITPSVLGASPAAAAGTETADVVIVGAGTSGIGAALAARTAGAARVVLLEETDYIGGQIAAGVGTIDEGGDDRFEQRADGIWGTIVRRMLAEYQRLGWPHTSTCYRASYAGNRLCFAPSVARRVYTQMLDEAGVDVRLNVSALPVVTDGAISAVTWASTVGAGTSGRIATTVVVDATEHGDVLAAAGARYRSGNGMGNTPGSAPAGHIQPITYPAIARTYAAGTMPEELDLVGKPFPVPIGDPDPAATQAAVVAAFARGVSATSTSTSAQPWGPLLHLRYRGLPNIGSAPYLAVQDTKIRRTALNYVNDFPHRSVGDLAGEYMPVRYLEDLEYRRVIDCSAKLRTIQFVWYMQNVLGQPQWSVADDEGFDTEYNRFHACSGTVVSADYAAFEAAMPLRPYVRESRRGVGSAIVTAKTIRRVATHEPVSGPYGVTNPVAAASQPRDTVAVGYYVPDLHGTKTDADLELDLETLADTKTGVPGVIPRGPFAIGLGSLLSVDVAGLVFAEKNISQSRLANGATRLQPETTGTGAAAGTVAALAAVRGVAPTAVPARDVQYRLTRGRQFLALNRHLDLPRSSRTAAAFELVHLANLDRMEAHTAARAGAVLTRAQAASWIRRTTGLGPARPVRFSDVPRSASYSGDLAALKAAGAPVSCAPGEFCPSAKITRETFMLWLGAAMDAGLGTSLMQAPDPTRGRFPDVAPGPVSAVIHSVARHLTAEHKVTFSSTFMPKAGMTRGAAAVWTAWVAFGDYPGRR